ncbi:hypothetical protein A3L01_09600 [Thermococcus barossii]|uniref:Uncharacterized protein n=1 Tax=Thermococcus barossii TaxID=54077 RepID=A0A2Z2MIQ3_9EURY|nr:hypothetical protein A3L01_09600 [Thermococcus barossii]
MQLSLTTEWKDPKNLFKIYLICFFLSILAWPKGTTLKEILGLSTAAFIIMLTLLYIWNLLAPTEDL